MNPCNLFAVHHFIPAIFDLCKIIGNSIRTLCMVSYMTRCIYYALHLLYVNQLYCACAIAHYEYQCKINIIGTNLQSRLVFNLVTTTYNSVSIHSINLIDTNDANSARAYMAWNKLWTFVLHPRIQNHLETVKLRAITGGESVPGHNNPRHATDTAKIHNLDAFSTSKWGKQA